MILVSIDLSNGFDTVDQGTFANRLENPSGVSDSSYRVCGNGSLSKLHSLISGVPQESVLNTCGPILHHVRISNV